MTLIILGTEGELGSALVQHYSQNYSKTHAIIGIDKEIKTKHDHITYHHANFKDKEAITEVIKAININGSSDVHLVSTVGIFGYNYQENEDVIAQFYETLAVNVGGVGHVCLSIIKEKRPHSFRAVLVGSTASHVGSRDVGYGTSKAGLNGLVISLSKCFSKKGYTFMGITPGIFESKMAESVSEERQQAAIQATHNKRKGRIDELINFIDYLTYNAPDHLTGSIFPINGGQYSG
jgi:NAD(P)-dependent dehydrogenase (short-subunit alcohol dehydrogenase family)